jgi:hypothetical protein
MSDLIYITERFMSTIFYIVRRIAIVTMEERTVWVYSGVSLVAYGVYVIA